MLKLAEAFLSLVSYEIGKVSANNPVSANINRDNEARNAFLAYLNT